MNLRSALLAAAILAAAFGIGLALWLWGARGYGDLWALTRAVQCGETLEAHIEESRRREATKRALAAEVITGNLTLREAANHFRRLDEAKQDYSPGLPRPPRDERALRENVLDFVWMVLRHQGRFAAAARWYAEAFATDQQLLAGPPDHHLFAAARAAACASCGRGRDAADLDDESRAGFRRQALDCLRAELEAQRRLLEEEPQTARFTVARDLRHWLVASDFTGVRRPEALGRLPEAERQKWQKLWADVTDTLAQALEAPAPAQKIGR
jgi:hypothetical protein